MCIILIPRTVIPRRRPTIVTGCLSCCGLSPITIVGRLLGLTILGIRMIHIGQSARWSEGAVTNAIRVDSNLSNCHCGPSDTYSNNAYSILGGKENVSFAIDTVEVYSDHQSYHKMMTREEKLRRNRNNG